MEGSGGSGVRVTLALGAVPLAHGVMPLGEDDRYVACCFVLLCQRCPLLCGALALRQGRY